MKKLIITIIISLISTLGLSQGSCNSPDGTMEEIDSPPSSYQELEDNGYCMAGTGIQTWHTMCFTFTPDVGDFTINMGYSASCANVSFKNFYLYNNSCVLEGTGLSYTGLSSNVQYTFCLDMKAANSPFCNGFERVCPYWRSTATTVPIELTFLGCEEGTIQWTTATEVNNDYFTIWASKDIDEWKQKVIIDGSGNKGTLTTYQYTDLECQGDTYYKLTQTDYDGTISEEGIVICECTYYKPQEYIIEEYNMMGQKIGPGSKGWKIIKIKKGERVVYEKIFSK